MSKDISSQWRFRVGFGKVMILQRRECEMLFRDATLQDVIDFMLEVSNV